MQAYCLTCGGTVSIMTSFAYTLHVAIYGTTTVVVMIMLAAGFIVATGTAMLHGTVSSTVTHIRMLPYVFVRMHRL